LSPAGQRSAVFTGARAPAASGNTWTGLARFVSSLASNTWNARAAASVRTPTTGVNWTHHRLRWIEPYWKGPDMAAIIEHAYRLEA